MRVGDRRVVYLGDDRARTVEIVRIAHRREVYR
jgi:mRNA-degrading endonuclease RelE of RelBE toxin-antitoxin system